VSLNSVAGDDWNNMIRALASEYRQPSLKELRRELIEYAKYLREHILFSNRGGRMSILTDGGTWAGRHFYFVIGFSPNQLELLDVVHLEKTDSQSIAQALCKIVKELENEMKCMVISICSDNE
jgi:hypothetical protein